MAYKNQSDKELMVKRSRKFVFEHKRTREVDGFEDIEIAKTIALSPSWTAVSEDAKKLVTKMKAQIK